MPVVIMNPLVAEQTEMRRSLLPGLLQSVAYNEAHGTANVQLDERDAVLRAREREPAQGASFARRRAVRRVGRCDVEPEIRAAALL